MADQQVDVETRFRLVDEASAKMRQMESSSDRLARHFSSARTQLVGLAGAAGVTLGAAGLLNTVKSLVSESQKLESTQFGLGSLLLQATRMGVLDAGIQDMNGALRESNRLYEELERHAARSDGTADDYVGAWQEMSLAVFQAKGDMRDVTELAKLIIPISKTFRTTVDVAARDVRQALMGQMTAVDRTTRLLGLESEVINKLARSNPEAALDMIIQKMQVASEGAKHAGDLFEAKSATIEDALTRIKRQMGAPLFAELKSEMDNLIGWADKHEDEIKQWARETGEIAKSAFEGLVDAAKWTKEHWSEIKTTVQVIAEVYIAKKMVDGMAAAVKLAREMSVLMGLSSAAGGAGAISSAGRMVTMAGSAAALAKLGAYGIIIAETTYALDKFWDIYNGFKDLSDLRDDEKEMRGSQRAIENQVRKSGYETGVDTDYLMRDKAMAAMGLPSAAQMASWGWDVNLYARGATYQRELIKAYEENTPAMIKAIKQQREWLDGFTRQSFAEGTLGYVLQQTSPFVQQKMADAVAKAAAAKPTDIKVTQNFHGGVTIKMDARHTDPDRVAAAVMNSLGRLSRRQVTARAEVYD